MLLVALFLALYYYTKSVDCYLMFCDGNCFWNVKRSVIWVSGAIFLWKIDSFLTKELWHDLLNLILHREIQLKSLIFNFILKRNNVTDNFSHLKLFIHQIVVLISLMERKSSLCVFPNLKIYSKCHSSSPPPYVICLYESWKMLSSAIWEASSLILSSSPKLRQRCVGSSLSSHEFVNSKNFSCNE